MLTKRSFSTGSPHSYLPVGTGYSSVSKSPPVSPFYLLFLSICPLMIWTNDVCFFLLKFIRHYYNFGAQTVLDLANGCPQSWLLYLCDIWPSLFVKYSLPSHTARGPSSFGLYLPQAPIRNPFAKPWFFILMFISFY